MTDDPKYGIDYLIDYYAVLEIERNSDEGAIKKAHRKLQMQYHPDRYNGLAREFQIQAAEKSRIVEEGYKILSDPAKRAAYDAELAKWQGPVSTSGFPIIDLSRPHFAPFELLGDEKEEKSSLLRQFANQFSGYDPNTFALIEKMYLDSPNPSPELVTAYKEQLRKKEVHLVLEERLTWESVGFRNQPIEESTRTTYADEIEKRLEAAAEEITTGITRTLLLVASGEAKLLGPGGEDLTNTLATDDSALAEYQKKAKGRFDVAANKIRDVAKERSAIAEKKLKGIRIEYRPTQEKIFEKLLVCVGTREKHAWFSLKLKGTTAVPNPETESVDLEELLDEHVANRWIENGYNVLFFELQDGLDLKEQLSWVITEHFAKLPE